MKEKIVLPPICELLKMIPDPRNRRGVRYTAESLLYLSFAAILSGCDGVTSISQWGKLRTREERRALGFYLGKTPSPACLFRFFRDIDITETESLLRDYFKPAGILEDAFAVDGKVLTGTGNSCKTMVNLLSVFGHTTNIVFNQKIISCKTNEITVIIPLLAEMDISGKVVTADAMHTQKGLCEWIIHKNADYILTVKDNQKDLRADLSDCFGPFPPV